MKKTAYLAILCFIALPAFSQKEAMQTGTPPPRELTINGKPYSQYKAEQDALKQQQAAKQQAAMVNRPKGLNITPNTETADPALQRMNEPVQYGVKVVEDKGATAPVEQQLVDKKQNEKAAPQPEVPALFRLPAETKWDNASAKGITVKNNEAPQIKSDPAQPVNAPVRGEAYKTPVMKDVNNGGGKKDMNPADAKAIIPSSVVSNKQPEAVKPAPEVPAQFRLQADAGSAWGNTSVTEMPAKKNSDPSQPLNAQAVTETYKTPVVKDVNTNGGKKDLNPADAKAITPASVVSNKQPETVKPAPEVPSQFRLPAAQSWNGRPVNTEAGTSLSTEKAVSRTAADAPKTIEVDADKVQKPAVEKNTTPAPVAAGSGETSKVAVPDVKYPQQEAPKKD